MFASKQGTAVIAAVVSVISISGTAWACGDKLVALGGGVGFERVVVSRNPGHIVMMLEPATGLAAADEKFNLAGSLRLAGHEVFVVKNAAELRAQRAAVRTDLILVDAARAKELQFQPVANTAGPVILPVVYSADRPESAPMDQQTGCVAVAGGRKGAQLLKAVEHALKLRSRGLPVSCGKSADIQQA
ncbi:MAG: hypothetical protein ACREVI_07670 [Steroidobacteraceae bacterium]